MEIKYLASQYIPSDKLRKAGVMCLHINHDYEDRSTTKLDECTNVPIYLNLQVYYRLTRFWRKRS
jgi:hypothetical protein